jgi:hypothetical protein
MQSNRATGGSTYLLGITTTGESLGTQNQYAVRNLAALRFHAAKPSVFYFF